MWLDSLDAEDPSTQAARTTLEISKTCARARELLQQTKNTTLDEAVVLQMVKELYSLDEAATTWRNLSGWTYQEVLTSEVRQNSPKVCFYTESVELHPDIWIAYEWDYHRTARILLHDHLLRCLDRLVHGVQRPRSKISDEILGQAPMLRKTSEEIIDKLGNQILSTVPQMLGDIDRNGQTALTDAAPDSQTIRLTRGIGGYFLLWPMKILKSNHRVHSEKREAAARVFQRIRQCTGMEVVMGERSNI